MKKLTLFESHLNKQYGIKGTSKRKKFESNSLDFRQAEIQKEKRKNRDKTFELEIKKIEHR